MTMSSSTTRVKSGSRKRYDRSLAGLNEGSVGAIRKDLSVRKIWEREV